MNNYDSAEEMQAAATKIAPINNFHGNINNFNEEKKQAYKLIIRMIFS